MCTKVKSIVISTVILLTLLFFWGQPAWTVTPQQLKMMKGKEKAETAEEVQPPEQLPGDQIDAFMATLSDEQVRRLLIEELKRKAEQEIIAADQKEPGKKTDALGLAALFDEADADAAAVFRRIKGIFRGSAAVLSQPRALIGLLTDGKGTGALFLIFGGLFALIVIGLFAEWLLMRLARDIHEQLLTAVPRGALQKLGNIFCRLLLDGLGVGVYILITFVLFVIFYNKGTAAYLTIEVYLIVSYYVRVLVFLAKFILAPARPTLRLVPMADEDAQFLYRWFVRIIAVAAVIVGASSVIARMAISEDLQLLLYSAAGLSVFLLLIAMIWQSRERVAQAICRDTADSTCDHSPLRAGFAKSWHIFAILYVILVGCFWQISALLAGKVTILKLIASLFVIPLFLGIDQWGQRLLKVASGELPETIDLSGDAEPDSLDESTIDAEEKQAVRPYVPFVKRLFRIVLVVTMFFLILRLWGIDISVTRVFSSTMLSVIVILLIGLIVWEYSKTLIDRKLAEEFPDDEQEIEEGGAGGTRKGTLLLLLRKFVLAVLVVIVAMIVLSELGVDIGPMIAGAGIVGLALGFGAQTLVRDIISGIFFLIDDAFRVGDYVETAGQRGTVEQISIRSMRLRHHRGLVHTIPFGGMSSVTNFSRDYHILKLDIRVRYDTDVEKVRKIIKKINKEIQKDEKLSAGLLGKVKSQGVRQMDDSAMIMRVKFKTIPGQQFLIRREVYKRIQEAFREQGIEFAHRNVTVYLPSETESPEPKEKSESEVKPSSDPDELKRQAAAAAAIAITREDEAEKGAGKGKDEL